MAEDDDGTGKSLGEHRPVDERTPEGKEEDKEQEKEEDRGVSLFGSVLLPHALLCL